MFVSTSTFTTLNPKLKQKRKGSHGPVIQLLCMDILWGSPNGLGSAVFLLTVKEATGPHHHGEQHAPSRLVLFSGAGNVHQNIMATPARPST